MWLLANGIGIWETISRSAGHSIFICLVDRIGHAGTLYRYLAAVLNQKWRTSINRFARQ